MMVVNLPSFETVADALTVDGLGDVVQVYLTRGPDGLIRGSVWRRATEIGQ